MSAVLERAAVSAAELRHAMGHFATGVCVVTGLDDGGRPVGTTVSAVSSLSCEPPLLLVCLSRRSQTLAVVRERGVFAVNVLAADQHELSRNFARSGAVASWEGVSFGRWPSGAPQLHGALAALDCAVKDIFPGGDHEIVVGHVRAARVSGADDALLHFRGAYARTGAPR